MKAANYPVPGHDPEDSNGTASRLAALIQHEMPAASDIRIEGLRRQPGGFSRENWVFDAYWREAGSEHQLPLLLRSDPPTSPQETERSREFAVLRALESSGVPAPRGFWLDNAGQWIGKPSLLMQRMPGVCEWTALNGNRPHDVRLRLARDYIDALARIHAVDWHGQGLDRVFEHPGDSPARAVLGEWTARCQRFQVEPLPEMDLAAAWLSDRLPPPGDIVLVHGDYKPGNSLIDGDHLSAVLDWETAHLGDPLEDLGWMLMPPRKGEQQIEGSWEAPQILEAYAGLTGRKFDASAVHWWTVFSIYKLCVNNLAGVAGFVAQQSDRISQAPSWLFRRMLQMMAPTP